MYGSPSLNTKNSFLSFHLPLSVTQTQTNTPRTEEGCVRELEKWDVPVVPPRRSSCTDRRSRVLLIVSWLACPALDSSKRGIYRDHKNTYHCSAFGTSLLEANHCLKLWRLGYLDEQASSKSNSTAVMPCHLNIM